MSLFVLTSGEWQSINFASKYIVQIEHMVMVPVSLFLVASGTASASRCRLCLLFRIFLVLTLT